MKRKLVIPGRLPSLNEYSGAERRNRHEAAEMKREAQQRIVLCIRQQFRGVRFSGPVTMSYLWVERDRRRDKDNVAFAKKFVQDALVNAGTLHNDGWDWADGFRDDFSVDKKNPRVEVLIWEVGQHDNR